MDEIQVIPQKLSEIEPTQRNERRTTHIDVIIAVQDKQVISLSFAVIKATTAT